MTKTTKRSESPQDYTAFLKSLRLIFTSLIESHFEGDRDGYFSRHDQKLSISWRCRPLSIKSKSFEVRAEVKVTVSNSKPKKNVFDLTAIFLLHLHTPAPVRRDHINRFTESEARLLVWPYVREYVTATCGRMHVPPIVVPFAGGSESANSDVEQ